MNKLRIKYIVFLIFIESFNNCLFCQDYSLGYLKTLKGENYIISQQSRNSDSVFVFLTLKDSFKIKRVKHSDSTFDFKSAFFELDSTMNLPYSDYYGIVFIPILLSKEGELLAVGKSEFCNDEITFYIEKAIKAFDFKKYLKKEIDNMIYMKVAVDISHNKATKFISIDK